MKGTEHSLTFAVVRGQIGKIFSRGCFVICIPSLRYICSALGASNSTSKCMYQGNS